MIEVSPRLFVGNAIDYETGVKRKMDGWAVLHCAKEPYHRDMVGYTGRALDRDHTEYLMALRKDRMALNMVDAPKPEFFSPKMVDGGISFIGISLASGKKVLVHCNQGGSRAPVMAMLYLAPILPDEFGAAEDAMRALYPMYEPAAGIRGYAQQNWQTYRRHVAAA